MSELILDVRTCATRHYLYRALLEQLSEEQQQSVYDALKNAGVPLCHHSNLGAVLDRIAALLVSERVKRDMRAIYRILAEAEAEVHACCIEDTHFHEVGEGESIRSVVGICLAIEAYNPDRIVASPVQVGKGEIRCAHGLLSVPAPATAAILARGIPVCSHHLEGELCTPTSAAVLAYFVDTFIAEECFLQNE